MWNQAVVNFPCKSKCLRSKRFVDHFYLNSGLKCLRRLKIQIKVRLSCNSADVMLLTLFKFSEEISKYCSA